MLISYHNNWFTLYVNVAYFKRSRQYEYFGVLGECCCKQLEIL